MSASFSFKGPGWCKYYANGSTYVASDPELLNRTRSWTRSPNDNLVMVSIRDRNNIAAHIKGTGNFWQSDVLEAEVVINETVKGTTIARRIMKQIQAFDKSIIIRHNGSEILAAFQSSIPVLKDANVNNFVIPIDPVNIGSWFVLEIDSRDNKYAYYVSPTRV